MLRKVTLFMFLSCIGFAYGEEVQTQLPWGATYGYIEHSVCYGKTNHYLYLSSKEDSIGANSLRYHKVYHKHDLPFDFEKDIPCGAIRQDGDRVYVLGSPDDIIGASYFRWDYYSSSDNYRNGEYLLYDFSLNTRDILPYSNVHATIQKTELYVNYDITRKMIIPEVTFGEDNHRVFDTDKILSGIGKIGVWFFKPINNYTTCLCCPDDAIMELNGVVSKDGDLLYISNNPDYSDPLLLNTSQTKVQTELPWGATYSYIQYICDSEVKGKAPVNHYMYLSSKEDSIGTNGLRYHKIYYKYKSPFEIEKGIPCYAIRQEGDKVYVLGDPNNTSNNPGGAPNISDIITSPAYDNYNIENICNGEYLLYDFGLKTGDTIPNNITNSKINEIKEISNSNINYRLFIDDLYSTDRFLSGIGKTRVWFFKPIILNCSCICNESDLIMNLNGVVSKEGNLLYISNTPDYSDPLISRFNSVESQKKDASEITIAQSLAKQLLVSFPVLNLRSQLNIYDMQGQLRVSERIQTGESSVVLDIEKLKEGIYILQMSLNNKSVSKQFIIK